MAVQSVASNLGPAGQKVDRCFRHGCLRGSGYFEGIAVERRITTSPGADGPFDADDLNLPQPSALTFGLEFPCVMEVSRVVPVNGGLELDLDLAHFP